MKYKNDCLVGELRCLLEWIDNGGVDAVDVDELDDFLKCQFDRIRSSSRPYWAAYYSCDEL